MANLDGIEEINFVAHSMGNIVVRHYLADLKQPDPRFRRMVMLAPPNHGSLAAVVVAENVMFKTFTGEAGQELGLQWSVRWRNAWPRPASSSASSPAASRTAGAYNPLLPGDNDGTISVDTTRLAGAADFLMLPVVAHAVSRERRQGAGVHAAILASRIFPLAGPTTAFSSRHD